MYRGMIYRGKSHLPNEFKQFHLWVKLLYYIEMNFRIWSKIEKSRKLLQFIRAV